MCGIAGIVSFKNKIERVDVKLMIDQLIHRGPNGEGIEMLEENMVALGHRRLSILDLSENGNQPMHYANDRYTITFNGEIYNYIELKTELIKKGYQFKTGTDTEVLLALFDLKREKCLTDLDGMFAFALWDKKEKILFCARDRFGEKPFYYCNKDGKFSFASEMKSLFAIGISREKNQRRKYNYLLYTILEDPFDKSSTFYTNILQLEPAHYMIISSGNEVVKKQYWDIDLTKKSTLSLVDSIEKFQELFTLSIERRLRSDVPVGSSLSGGLDSSSIVLLIDKIKKEGSLQKTFSARFKNFSRDEGDYMQLVIEKSRVEPHFVFPSVDSVMQNIDTIFKHQEEPIGSSSIAVQYEVMKLAKDNGITVLLDGQGADEMLAGYSIFWQTYFSQLYRSDRKLFRAENKAYLEVHNNLPYENNLAFKWKSYNPNTIKNFGNLARRFRSSNKDFFLGIHPDIVNEFKNDKNPLPKINSLKQHLYFYLMKRGLNELLRYADRNAMANSVEVRLPFLFHELVEFSLSLPEKMLLNEGWSKFILRLSMANILPKEITWRKDKIGFEPPQNKWLNATFFQDYLNEAIISLKKDKIITNVNPNLYWNYISLYAFNKNC